MAPQIIYIALFLIALVIAGYRHGKQKKGRYNLWVELTALLLGILLLYWGGFFDILFHR